MRKIGTAIIVTLTLLTFTLAATKTNAFVGVGTAVTFTAAQLKNFIIPGPYYTDDSKTNRYYTDDSKTNAYVTGH